MCIGGGLGVVWYASCTGRHRTTSACLCVCVCVLCVEFVYLSVCVCVFDGPSVGRWFDGPQVETEKPLDPNQDSSSHELRTKTPRACVLLSVNMRVMGERWCILREKTPRGIVNFSPQILETASTKPVRNAKLGAPPRREDRTVGHCRGFPGSPRILNTGMFVSQGTEAVTASRRQP